MAPNKITSFWTKGTLKMHLLTHKGSQFTPAIQQVIPVHSLTNNSHNKTNKCTNVKIIFFLHTSCRNSDTFLYMLYWCSSTPWRWI